MYSIDCVLAFIFALKSYNDKPVFTKKSSLCCTEVEAKHDKKKNASIWWKDEV